MVTVASSTEDHGRQLRLEELRGERQELNAAMGWDPSQRTHANYRRRDAIDSALERLEGHAPSGRVDGILPANLAEYLYHAERFGPECVMETAAGDLDERDLGELKAWFESKQRSHYWQEGRAGAPDGHWKERREKPHACKVCGLDLPIGSPSRRLSHDHCRMAAARRRYVGRLRARSDDSIAV